MSPNAAASPQKPQVDLKTIAIRLGLEDPASREKRIRAEEEKADKRREQEDRIKVQISPSRSRKQFKNCQETF